MIALWRRLVRLLGSWEPAVSPRRKARRMAKGWWRNPPAYDRGWRRDVAGKPF
jgi:hypothetical protein